MKSTKEQINMKFTKEQINMKFTKESLVELGKQYQTIMGLPEGKVLVEFVDQGRRNAIIRISKELVLAVSTSGKCRIHLALGEAVQSAKLVEHGIWIVISQDGTKFKANPIAHENEKLTD